MEFLPPGAIIRWWDDNSKDFIYLRLLEREGPLKYPYTFSALSAGSESDEFKTEDLNPSKTHIYNLYLGVRPGIQVRVWHPYDEKLLKWDEKLDDIDDDEAANIEHKDSPYEKPKFSVWVKRDRYPGLIIKNIINRTIKPQIIWIGYKYTYEQIKEPTVLDKLKRGVIKSTPVSWKKLA